MLARLGVYAPGGVAATPIAQGLQLLAFIARHAR